MQKTPLSHNELKYRFHLFLLLIAWFVVSPLSADTLPTVTKLRVQMLGDTVQLFYDLEGARKSGEEVLFEISQDGGKTWSQPKGAKGDVGEEIAGGWDKEIIWHIEEEFSQGLHKTLKFRVETRAEREVAPGHDMAEQLQECEAHLQANRLTSGQGGTALDCYQEVLEQDPDSAEAKLGLNKIVNRYLEWTETNLNLGKLGKAKGYYAKAFKIDPEGEAVLAMKARIEPTSPVGEMVSIKGGCFQMGSPSDEEGREKDERQHQVCVKDL